MNITSQEDAATSDYRGPAQLQSTDPPTTTAMHQRTNQNRSFAGITASKTRSKRDHAILFEVLSEITVQEYIDEFCNIVSPSDIRHVSRLSNGRLLVYLANKDLVQDLVRKQTTITVKNHVTTARPLVSEAQKIILSNVPPEVPDEVLEEEIKKMGIRILSKMTSLRSSLIGPQYAHIYSFRRQTYIHPEDKTKLPSSFIIHFEQYQYRIFTSTDNPTCYNCKQQGHIANKCTAGSNPHSQAQTQTITENPTISTNEQQTIPNVSQVTQSALPKTNRIKRPLSGTNSTDATSQKLTTKGETPIADNNINLKKTSSSLPNNKKKLKASISLTNPPDISAMLEPIRSTLEASPDQYIYDYDTLREFYEEAANNPNVFELAKIYTKDISQFTKVLRKLHPLFVHRSIKNRTSRIIKKLETHLNWTETMESDTDTDLDSTFSTSDILGTQSALDSS